MRPRGFALIGALWLLVVVGIAITAGFARLRVGAIASQNRIALTRGHWAAEACVAVAAARWGTARWADSASLDLGRGTRCTWRAVDPTLGINVNRAARALLERFFVQAGLSAAAVRFYADAVLELRTQHALSSLDELGFTHMSADILAALTVDGTGSINIAHAPDLVLRAVPGLSSEARVYIIARRERGRPVMSAEDLRAGLSPSAIATLNAAHEDFNALARFSSDELELQAVGWVNGMRPSPVATVNLLMATQSNRLALLRRRVF